MAEETNISWADHTFNPVIGCSRVSPACDACYAAHLMETRMGRVTWGGPGKGAGTRVRTSDENWRKPLAWDRKAAAAGARPFVFCASLADVFDNQWEPEWRRDLFDLIRATPNLVWLLLTKRPQNIVKLYQQVHDILPWPRNAAIGTTVEDQERADKNVVALINAKSALKPAFAFLSCEPLLGPIDLEYPKSVFPDGPQMCCSGFECGCMGMPVDPPLISYIDWVITGGETDQGDHKARPTHPDWFRSLRDQCTSMAIPFHHKQNGEWVSVSEVAGPGDHFHFPDGATVRRTGKKLSGRTIDGVTHNAFPAIRRMP
jgi:protein gp37